MMSEEFGRRASELSAEEFDALYRDTPPWVIGGPQPVFEALLAAGALRGRVLDVGCGTGEHALMAAAAGLPATGVDLSPLAIEQARAAARARGLDARFVVGDALGLSGLGQTFDTVIDSAVFHVFDDADRARYVESLGAVLEPGGRYLMLGFSDLVPGSVGPRRLSESEIRAAFVDGWEVRSLRRGQMRLVDTTVPAWVGDVVRR